MILAGGSSRRLGGIPKGLELIGGERSIDRVANALRPNTASLVLAANDEQAYKWLLNVAIVSDNYPSAGGLAGVEAGLSGGDDAVIVAWDMPFVTPELVALLLAEAREHEASIAVPESRSPHGFEPFCAYYAASVRPALADFLRSGGGAARDFVARIPRVRRIPLADIARLGDPDRLLMSFNSPADLERARELAGAK